LCGMTLCGGFLHIPALNQEGIPNSESRREVPNGENRRNNPTVRTSREAYTPYCTVP